MRHERRASHLRRAFQALLWTVALPATVEAYRPHHFMPHHRMHHHHHHGSSGGGSSAGCGFGPKAPASGPPKVVFVTSELFPGSFGGRAAADAACTAAATSLPGGGTYRAWLFDESTVADAFVVDDGPWVTTRGELAFTSKADLGKAPLATVLDPRGEAGGRVWSGVPNGGSSTCRGWSHDGSDQEGMVAAPFQGEAGWESRASIFCSERARILCFQQ